MKKTYIILLLMGFCSAKSLSQATWELTPKGIVYPRYNDGNRPVAPLTIGTTIYNTSQNTHQYWNGSTWTNVSTPGSGGGPWSVVGTNINNNTGNKVGINTANPTAALEVQGLDFIVSEPYTITSSPATLSYNIPANNTIPTITADAARIFDSGGASGTVIGNTNYAGYVYINPSVSNIGLRFTFESLDLGNSSNYQIIFSTSSDPNNTSSILRSIFGSSSNISYLNSPFNISASDVYIHFKITSGAPIAPGFQLLYQSLIFSTTSNRIPSEAIGGGLTFNVFDGCLAVGYSRVRGYNSIAMGSSKVNGAHTTAMGLSTASGNYSTAMGSSTAKGEYPTAMGISVASGNYSTAMGNSGASGEYSTAMGRQSNASGENSLAAVKGTASGISSIALGYNARASEIDAVAIGFDTRCNGYRSMVLGGYGGLGTDLPLQLVAGFDSYLLNTKPDFSTYAQLYYGTSTWTGVSDSTKKERFLPVSGEDILKKIAKFKLRTWSFKGIKERHQGPMAQDFYAAFGKDNYGTMGSDTTINSGDFDGINFAAIHALEKRTRDLQLENINYQQEVFALKQEVKTLYKTVKDFKQTTESFNSLKAEVEALKSVLSKNYPKEKSADR